MKKLARILPYYDIDYKIIKMYRKSNKLLNRNKYIRSRLIFYKVQYLYKCIISPSAEIGNNFKIPHPIGIVIGEKVKIGNNAIIYHNVTIGQNNNDFPQLGDNVVVYPGSIIVGKIKIGNNVIIGANSFVNKDIPDNTIVAGNPAKVIKNGDKKWA